MKVAGEGLWESRVQTAVQDVEVRVFTWFSMGLVRAVACE
jgi:hypothetical protein